MVQFNQDFLTFTLLGSVNAIYEESRFSLDSNALLVYTDGGSSTNTWARC